MTAWVNGFGVVFMAVLMIPNLVFARACPEGFENLWQNRVVEGLEQLGRFGCFGLMLLTPPGLCAGFASHRAQVLYLVLGGALLLAYCTVWVVCFRHNSIFRALALSILPSLLFLCSGLLLRYPLLVAAALLFAPCHIAISYKNARLACQGQQKNKA